MSLLNRVEDKRSLLGKLLPENQTSTPLDNGQTYTGEWVDVTPYASVTMALSTDTAVTAFADFSVDKINVDSSVPLVLASGGGNNFRRLSPVRSFFRMRIQNNSGVNQTHLRAQALAGQQQQLTSTLASNIQKDADAIVARVVSDEVSIADGKFVGHSIVNKFGRNPDIDSGSVPEDIWLGGGLYTGFPTGSAETVVVSSNSVNDSAAGTGARTVEIFGLDADYFEQNETITLVGDSAAASTGEYIRVNRLIVRSAGASAHNSGNLEIRHSSTTANVFAEVSPTVNQTQIAAYTVPAGKTGYLRHVFVGIRGGNAVTVDGSVLIRESGQVFRPVREFTAANTAPYDQTIYGGVPIPAKADIVIRVEASTANNVAVVAGFDILLVDN